MLVFADVRMALSAIQAPTLVMYRRGDRYNGKPHATYLAEHIRGAKLVELPGDDNLIFAGDSDADQAPARTRQRPRIPASSSRPT